ncbi:hypothetical protein SH2C18_04650 [Clostridium sediminicola]|uniref:GerW family sporulation protein n=1 Tax=Clostridium sediminicola TaxID=3114879 RepID=UPI0031F1D8BB
MENKSGNIDSIINITMENLRKIIDVNTIIGDPIETENTIIIPISKVCLGFASGGSNVNLENNSSENLPFAGGSGSGVSIKPIAFLVIRENTVRLLPMDQKNTYDKLVDQIPNAIDMITKFFDKENKDKEEDLTEE